MFFELSGLVSCWKDQHRPQMSSAEMAALTLLSYTQGLKCFAINVYISLLISLSSFLETFTSDTSK